MATDVDYRSGVVADNSRSPTRIGEAFSDIHRGFADWRVWTLLALNEVRGRYRRSAIGQFWLTISMAVSIVAMGLLWGMIFKSSVRNTLPFIGVGLMAWNLLLGLILDTSTAFIAAEPYLKHIRLAKTAIVNEVVLRNLIVFAHNVVLIPIILFFFPPEHHIGFLLIPVGLALYVVNGLWLGLVLGTLCTRFRDLAQILSSTMQLLFFITPVIWNPAQVGPTSWYVVHLNPLASFVSILRDPLLGMVPDVYDYGMVLIVTVAGFGIGIPLFARFRSRIVYWL